MLRPRSDLGCAVENRHGLAFTGDVSLVSDTAERNTALELVDAYRPGLRRITLGADKLFDVEDFVEAQLQHKVAPHIAIDGHLSKTGKPRKTAVDARTTRHAGYAVSLRCRKRFEGVFGWIKSFARLTQVKVRGLAKVRVVFLFTFAAYNLVRRQKLLAAT
jgi:hypothetical protein